MIILLSLTTKIPKMQNTLYVRDFFGFFGLMQNRSHTLKMRKRSKTFPHFILPVFKTVSKTKSLQRKRMPIRRFFP